jgi:hypothetical protein
MPLWAQAGFFVQLPPRAAGALLAMLADTMVPEASEEAHDFGSSRHFIRG